MARFLLILDERERQTIQLALCELRVVLEKNHGQYPADLRKQIAGSGVLRQREYQGLIDRVAGHPSTACLTTNVDSELTTYLSDDSNRLAERVVELAQELHDDQDDPQYEDLYSNDPGTAYQATERFFSNHESASCDITSTDDIVVL